MYSRASLALIYFLGSFLCLKFYSSKQNLLNDYRENRLSILRFKIVICIRNKRARNNIPYIVVL